jgi:nucleoside-diphosphate-sugar epimerase
MLYFPGKERNTERTFSFPRTKYGFTKLLGDLSAFRNLVIRTSFVGVPVNGSGSNGLVMKCKNARPNDVIFINDNYVWNGITVEALVQLALVIVQESQNFSGIFHIGASSNLSREQLIRLILARIERNDLQISVEDRRTTRNLSLETNKYSTIAAWWADTNYKTVPNLTDLLNNMELK